jgi:CelD/BcsL family acetyltransferase involved in cellulose biosynthesis
MSDLAQSPTDTPPGAARAIDRGRGLSLTTATTGEAFKALRTEWEALLEHDDRATVFQTWEFQYHAWRIFADEVEPLLLLVRDDEDRLVGCAPLGSRVWRLGPLSTRILGFLTPKFCDYGSFIIHRERSNDVLAAIAGWLSDHLNAWHVIQLRSVREDSWTRSEDDFLALVGRPYRIERTSEAPYLQIDPEWTDYQDALSRKRAKSMRYEVNRLSRQSDGQFQTAEGSTLETRSIEQFMDLHQQRMRDKFQHGHFANQRVREGFVDLIRSMSEHGLARIDAIIGREGAMSAICMFHFRGVASMLLGGLDPQYAALSPGKVVLAYSIDQALHQGAREYDFLEGTEPYKSTWTQQSRPLFTIDLPTRSWRRHLYYCWHALRRLLSRSDRARAIYFAIRGSKGPMG